MFGLGWGIRRVVVLLVSVVFMLPGTTAFGQVADPVLQKGACPQESVLAGVRKYKEGDSEDLLEDSSSIPNFTWVLEPGKLALFEQPALASSEIDLSNVRPLDQVEIVGPSSEGDFWLVQIKRWEADAKGQILRTNIVLCGWMQANTQDGLLKWEEDTGLVTPLPQGKAPPKHRVPGSTISLKAVVHSLGGGGDSIPLFRVPSKNGEAINRLRQFEILDAFAWVPDAKNSRKFFYLLGRKAAPARPPIILGWAHEDDIAIWSTRMAAYWTGKGGRGYSRQRGRGEVLLEGPVGVPDAGDAITRKYPVLNTIPNNRHLTQLARKKSAKNILRLIKDVRLVVPGHACRDAEGRQCIPPEQFEAIKARIQAKKDELSKIDIVFLIDGTKSMTRYFAPVARGVREFVNGLQHSEGVSIRVAASIYGDYSGTYSGRDAVQYERVVARHDPVDTADIDDLVDKAKKGYISDPQKDKLEAPFAAILRTISDDSRWGDHKGFRYLVHIADHGNRLLDEGPKGNLTNGHAESVSLDDVVNALRKKGIIYVPIAVSGDGPGEAGERFRRQARKISEKLEGFGRRLQVVQGGPESTKEEVLRFLQQAIEVRREALTRLELINACHEREDINDPKACVKALEQGSSFKARLATAALKKLGLDTEAAHVAGYVQRTLPVWVPPFQDGKQVIDFWLMLEPEKTQALTDFTLLLCRKFYPGNITQGQKILKEALVEALDIASGEDAETAGMSVADALRRQLFIPGWALSNLFGKPWDVLKSYIQKKMMGRPEHAKKWNKHFCRQAYLLKQINESDERLKDESLLKCDYNRERKYHECGTPEENLRPFRWYYDFGNEQRFYFIPLRYLP